MITLFEVCSKMKEGDIHLFYNMGGGKQIGKAKDKKAVIEVFVDNDTFQNYAFQRTYGHAKQNSREKVFVLLAIDTEEFDKQYELLLKSRKKKNK